MIVEGGILINKHAAYLGVKADMPDVVVDEVPGVGSITDNEELDEAEDRAVTPPMLIILG